MVQTLAVAGFTLGVVVQLFAHSMQRIPLTRYPYVTLASGLAAGYLLPVYDGFVEDARKVVEQKQQEKLEQNVKVDEIPLQ